MEKGVLVIRSHFKVFVSTLPRFLFLFFVLSLQMAGLLAKTKMATAILGVYSGFG
jgi:hypothetical protein